MIARVVLTFDVDEEQLARARARASDLDAGNLGTDDPPESYSAELALARILASDDELLPHLIPAYTDGFTAVPEGDR
jgi:hypothetical protein